ncbi:MAG TPA: hypothetical protein VLL25_08105 [Acidimicrobiales bacterium]|nr:hypothetical protein [Acidimicrobiales bacterium]
MCTTVLARRWRAAWIYGPGPDLLIALCWVPMFLIGHRLSAGVGDDELLRRAVAAAFLVSFLHQPLTLGLVYGDARRFRERRRLFVWAPPITLAVIVVAVTMHLWVIIPIAAVWNTVHTLQQRYGLSRIYARKSGYGSARLDRGVLYAWMTAVALIVAANPATLSLVRRVGLDHVNGSGVRLLTDLRPLALAVLVPVGAVALFLAAAIVRQEVRVGVSAANPAKWVYQASSLALIAAIAVDPAAGFIAYVGAHAIEYFVIVYKTAETRYGPGIKRVACLGGIVGLALVAHGRLHAAVYDTVIYTVGTLHFLYDSFIWKLRKPTVAADFAIRS